MIFLANLVIYFCFNAQLATSLIYFILQPCKLRSALRRTHTHIQPLSTHAYAHKLALISNTHTRLRSQTRTHIQHPHTPTTHYLATHPPLLPRHALLIPLPTNDERYGIIISWFETRPYTKAIVCGRFIFY